MNSKSFKNGVVFNADCIKVMDALINKDMKIDMILCDLPFGTTASNWDKAIPAKSLWERYKKLISDNGSIVLFASGQFMPYLLSSNLNMFKYQWVWVKNNSTNFVHAKNRPMTKCEYILVFSKAPMGHVSQLGDKRMIYNPQGLIECNKKIKAGKGRFGTIAGERPSHKSEFVREYTNYPNDVLLDFPETPASKKLHTNEKPIKLLEYLVKTYTNGGQLVMDNTMGVGSTCIACQNVHRKFIGIELDEKYYNIAVERLQENENNIV